MPSRQFHTKSRHGCAQCKRRHVRCDFQRPNCGGCLKRHMRCDFADQELPTPQKPPSPPSSSASSVAASPSRPLTPLGTSRLDESMRVLEFVHHYVCYIAPNLSSMPAIAHVWVHQIPRLANEQTFLADGILAYAALDLYTLQQQPSPHLLKLARAYHGTALKSMREQLLRRSPANRDALFALSSFIFGYVQALPVAEEVDLFANTRTLARLLKGTAGIKECGPKWGASSALRAINKLPESEAGEIQTPGCVEAIDRLQFWNEATPSLMQAKFRGAIDALRRRMRAVESQDLNMGLCSLWLLHVDDDFFDCVDRGDALALSILAVFAVIQWKVRRWHWIGNRGEQLLRCIASRLGPAQSSCIEWPLQAMGLPATAETPAIAVG